MSDPKHPFVTQSAEATKDFASTVSSMNVKIPKSAIDAFNEDLIASGLIPERIADISPITVQLGLWMGENMRAGVPLNEAIAEVDVVAGAPVETLMGELDSVAERVRVYMLKASLEALAMCCQPGRVVEAATFIIKTTSLAVQDAVSEHLPA